MVADVKTEFHIVQNSHVETCKTIAAAARLSDIVIAVRPANGLSLDQNLIERMLYTSGCPLLVIPPNWDNGPRFQTIVVAWDGSARATRAVGDSILSLRARIRSKSSVRRRMCQNVSKVLLSRIVSRCIAKR